MNEFELKEKMASIDRQLLSNQHAGNKVNYFEYGLLVLVFILGITFGKLFF